MAKIIVAGQAVVVTSSISLEDLQKVEKYRPDALVLYKGEGAEKEPDFKIGLSDGAGRIGKYGIEFGAESNDEQKLASVTMIMPEPADDVKEFISDAIGASVLKLSELEKIVPEVLEEIEKEREEISRVITIAG